MGEVLEYTGWGIALFSAVINYLQYRKNKQLKTEISNTNQTHSGKGDNFNVGGDADINKK